MSSFAKSVEAPFVAEGGLPAVPQREDDPYRALDDLMVVVEALCPVCPQRGTFPSDAKFLL
jgi:hypothetical protein